MEPVDLPEELRELERDLSECYPATLENELRQRVMNAVRRESGHVSTAAGGWSFAAASIAAFFLLANLSMVLANDSFWNLGRESSRVDTRVLADEIRELLPELSEEAALGHALLLQGRSQLVMTPDLRRSYPTPPTREENSPWDTP